MKNIISILFIVLIFNSVNGQNQEKYSKYVNHGYYLLKNKQYKKSIKKFQRASDELDGKMLPKDRYQFASAFALLGDVKNSFFHLFYLAENKDIKYHNIDRIVNDTNLTVLHTHERWQKLIKTIESNKTDYEKNFDWTLIAMLDTVFNEDQKYRNQINKISNEFGWKSKEVDLQWKVIKLKDSINLVKVKKLLDQRGWLGSRVIGKKGSSALFLVIQHSNLETQEKYLPMLKEAVKKGDALATDLALLQDRVALGRGKKQIYGTQLKRDSVSGNLYVLPLIDPENVNKRRADIGLDSMESYLDSWGIKWNLKKYLKQTSKTESKRH